APRHRWTLATPPIPGHNAVTLQPLCRDNRRERALLLLQVMRRGRAAIEKRPTARPRRVAALVIGTLPSRQPPNVHAPLHDGTMRRGDIIRREPSRGIGISGALILKERSPARNRAERIDRVVGDESRDDELAQCVAQRVTSQSRGLLQLEEEQSAARLELLTHRSSAIAQRRLRDSRQPCAFGAAAQEAYAAQFAHRCVAAGVAR